MSPIKNARGEVIGASKIARDITERKRAEEAIRAAYEQESAARAEAELANRLKDEFLATVSHELRSPLNSILGWARMLSDKRLDEEKSARALEVIYRSARAQNQLISDLLDVSRIITGKSRLDVSMVELIPIIEAAMDVVRPAADAKKIRLVSALDPAAGPVSGDADRLQQIVWNLLSNAVKFTPAGGQIAVRLEREGAQRHDHRERHRRGDRAGVSPLRLRPLPPVREPPGAGASAVSVWGWRSCAIWWSCTAEQSAPPVAEGGRARPSP